jgi:hypothetical protein
VREHEIMVGAKARAEVPQGEQACPRDRRERRAVDQLIPVQRLETAIERDRGRRGEPLP